MNFHALIDAVAFDRDGLIVAIVQDHRTDEVLMVAYMNADTLRQTLETGRMTYWSRSRAAVWVKGETSGHTQEVRAVRLDCDGDALLFKVEQRGEAACHTGHRSCFHRAFEHGRLVELGTPIFNPGEVYGT